MMRPKYGMVSVYIPAPQRDSNLSVAVRLERASEEGLSAGTIGLAGGAPLEAGAMDGGGRNP